MGSPRVNWEVYIVCKDCGERFEVMKPDPSTQVLENDTRLLLLAVPNACPECHNIRPVAKVEKST